MADTFLNVESILMHFDAHELLFFIMSIIQFLVSDIIFLDFSLPYLKFPEFSLTGKFFLIFP